MVKVTLGLVMVMMLAGCTQLETVYLAGEAVGKQVLPEEVKEELKPYNEGIKDGYIIIKKASEAKED